MKLIRLLSLGIMGIFCGLDAVAQNAAGYQWNSVAIGGGGFVSSIIPSKTQQDLVYARTDVGGAYRWDEDNQRWIPLTDWVSEDETGYLGVESIATDPQQPNRVYMLAGISYFNSGKTALLRSTDYGDTFTVTDVSSQFKAHGNGMGRQTGEKLHVDPHASNILYTGTRWNGLFKSNDYGETWSRLSGLDVTATPNENGISFVVLDPDSSAGGQTQTLFVGVSRFTSAGANLYRSDDGGQTFSAIPNAPTNNMPHRAALASDGNLFITYGDGAGPHGHWAQPEPMELGEVWRYNIHTHVWTNITPAGFTRPFGGVSIDPESPSRVVLSTLNTWLLQYADAYGDRILISTDSGASWTDVVERGFAMNTQGNSWIDGKAIHWTGSIEFDPFNSDRVWVTSGNGVFRTNNINAATTTWDFTVAGLEETVPLGLISIPDGPLISVIGDYDGFRHTDPAEYAPIHSPSMGTSTGIDFARLNPDVVVRVGGGDNPGMFYSQDMGLTWTATAAINGTNGQVAVAADGHAILHSPSESSTTYRSTDFGSTWTAVSGVTVTNARPVADPVNADKFYIYDSSGGRLLMSTDGGASFASAGTVTNNGSKLIRLAPGREGDIWVPLFWGGLTRSTDSGASFAAINGVSYAGAVGFGKAASGSDYPTVFIWGTVNNVRGVYRSTDAGASWVRVNDDAHQYGGPANGEFVLGDMNVFGRVYLSTAGRGIAYGELVEGTSSSSSSNPGSSSSVGSSSSSDSSSSVSSSSSTSSSLVSSSASSSVGDRQCNWYGTLLPLCVTTQSGWGWENGQSCVAVSTCSTQPAPYGIVGGDSDDDSDGSASSSVRSSVMSSSVASSSQASSSVQSQASSQSNSMFSSSAVSSASSSLAGTNGTCEYLISNEWGNGFTGAIRITNNGTAAVNDWTVSWNYSDATEITNTWNASVSGSNPYSASNTAWNGSIQPGQSVEFGFQGTKAANDPAQVPVVTGSLCN